MPAFRTRPPVSGHRSDGFTLLEVLIAITILSVCVTALYNAFRISSRAFSAGRQSAETLQTLRFITDQVARDLRGVRFDENYRRHIQAIEGKILSSSELIIRQQQAGEPVRLPGIIEIPAEKGKDSFVGLMGNFQFLGEDKDKTDSIEFTRRMAATGDFDDAFLGAERVRYFVWNNNLYRRRSKAFQVMLLNPALWEDLVRAREASEAERDAARKANTPYIDYWRLQTRGALPPQIEPPFPIRYFVPAPSEPQPPELIARNVVTFDLSYGLYSGGQWTEAQTWDSEAKQHRTPEFLVPMTDPAFSTMLSDFQNRAADNLPSYVRLRVGIDPSLDETKKPRKTGGSGPFEVECTVWIPAAQETYVPRDQWLFQPTPEESYGAPAPGVSRGVSR